MIINLLYVYNDSEYKKTQAFIESRGINVFAADSIDMAYTVFTHNPIHLILLDQTLKDGNGINFIQYLREKEILTPVIIILKSHSECDLLQAINLNITQCLTKPYSQEALCDALKIATNKSVHCHPLAYTKLNSGYSYDPLNKQITSNENEIIKLCNKEALLIELLLQNGENITSYEMIENIVWQDSFMSVESLRTLIRGIRHKTHKNIITNHNGIGYKLNIA